MSIRIVLMIVVTAVTFKPTSCQATSYAPYPGEIAWSQDGSFYVVVERSESPVLSDYIGPCTAKIVRAANPGNPSFFNRSLPFNYIDVDNKDSLRGVVFLVVNEWEIPPSDTVLARVRMDTSPSFVFISQETNTVVFVFNCILKEEPCIVIFNWKDQSRKNFTIGSMLEDKDIENVLQIEKKFCWLVDATLGNYGNSLVVSVFHDAGWSKEFPGVQFDRAIKAFDLKTGTILNESSDEALSRRLESNDIAVVIEATKKAAYFKRVGLVSKMKELQTSRNTGIKLAAEAAIREIATK